MSAGMHTHNMPGVSILGRLLLLFLADYRGQASIGSIQSLVGVVR